MIALSEAAQERHAMVEASGERLAHIGYRGLHVRGMQRDEFVLTCIKVDSRWRWLVDQLMPGHDWQQYRDRGEEPIARGSALFSLCEVLVEQFPDLKSCLMETPSEGMVKLIALDDGGATVYDIEPRPEALHS